MEFPIEKIKTSGFLSLILSIVPISIGLLFILYFDKEFFIKTDIFKLIFLSIGFTGPITLPILMVEIVKGSYTSQKSVQNTNVIIHRSQVSAFISLIPLGASIFLTYALNLKLIMSVYIAISIFLFILFSLLYDIKKITKKIETEKKETIN